MNYRLVTTFNSNGVFDPCNGDCSVTQVSEEAAYALIKSDVAGVGRHYFISVVLEDGNIEDVTERHVWSWEKKENLEIVPGVELKATRGDNGVELWSWRVFTIKPTFCNSLFYLLRDEDLLIEASWESCKEELAGFLRDEYGY